MASVGQVVFEVSANLKQISGQLRTLEGSFQGSFNRIENQAKQVGSKLLGAFGIGLGIGSVVAFTKSVIDLGDQLSDLSDQTGLSIQVLGGIKPTLDASNSSLEAFAKGFAKVQRSLGDLAGEGKQAAEALRAIKLDPQQLANAAPDQALESLVNALAKVENRNERAAIATRLFSRSAAELIPTILQLADNGITKLDDATAEAFKRLGALKDQFVFLGAAIATYAAPPLAGFIELLKIIRVIPLSGLEQLQKNTKSAREEIDRLDKAISAVSQSPDTRAGKAQQLAGLTEQRNKALQKFIDLNSKVIQQDQKPAPGKVQGLLPTKADTSGVDKLKAAMDGFRDSLIKTIIQQEIEEVKLTLGEHAALKASQAYDVLALRAKLAADKTPIPPEIQRSAVEAEATLKSLGANVEVLGEKSFAKLQAGALAGAGSLDELKKSLQDTQSAVQAFADAANEGVGIQIFNKDDIARQHQDLKSLEDQFRALQKSLAIEILPPDQREAAQQFGEFEDRVKAINEWRDAAIAAGRDVQQANQEAAQATSDAWVVAAEKSKEVSDEMSEFTRRAFERGFDAVSDGLKDMLDGNVTSFKDFAQKLTKTWNGLIADFATTLLKNAVLGEDFGKKGGGIGGLLGGLIGNKPAESKQLPGTTAADTLDAEFGQQLAGLSQGGTVAIEAASAVAQTSITALQAESMAIIQSGSLIAETTITTVAATAQAGIAATEAAALAAIAAAQAGAAGSNPGAPGILGLFSKLGGTPSDQFTGGATGPEASFYHRGGQITADGRYATFRRAVVMHAGGEVPLIGEVGEYMVNNWAAKSVGKPTMDYINQTGKLPAMSPGQGRTESSRSGPTIFNISNPNFTDRRSMGQTLGQLGKAVRQSKRNQ